MTKLSFILITLALIISTTDPQALSVLSTYGPGSGVTTDNIFSIQTNQDRTKYVYLDSDGRVLCECVYADGWSCK